MTKERKIQKEKNPIEHWHVVNFFLLAYDIVTVNAAYFLALWLRFDCSFSLIPDEYLSAAFHFAPFYTAFCLLVFFLLRLYQTIWRFAGFSEIIRVTLATVITSVFCIIATLIFFIRMPASYYIFGLLLQFCFTIGIRFSYRFVLLERERVRQNSHSAHRVMLIGDCAYGKLILKDLHRMKELTVKVCCIIDDNPNKVGRYIEGIPVVGGRDDILLNVEKYQIDRIFFAIPSATPEQRRDILNICNESGCDLKTLPGIYQLINDNVSIRQMKDVAVEDLLGREPIRVDTEEIFCTLTDQVILVTGGGGSIGSELCRQIAQHLPRRLIIFDIYENNAYDIEQELKSKYPNLNLIVLIGSVRDVKRIDSVYRKYRPDITFHAAAHKHVPLMEASPCEAIKNNVIGTYNTACAAMRNHCKRFVLISTDKAVNPTNVMGASKRICEMIVQSLNTIQNEHKYEILPAIHKEMKEEIVIQDSHTEFVAVRFGNVLGSNGSVIPLFKKQIANGGPVTVTHPDIIRYFMTIPEAVSLVLQAGVYAKGGEIFVLNMGEPVKIDTLARNLIKLSGFKPEIDIPIVYTGLRPGEKLYEEKLMLEEGLAMTANDLIYVGKPIHIDIDGFMVKLRNLASAAYDNDENICEYVAEIVDTYRLQKDRE